MSMDKQIRAYFDRFCMDCGDEISKHAGGGAKRCEKCRIVFRREYRREWARERAKMAKREKRKGKNHGNT